MSNRRWRSYLARFYRKAYEDNLMGLSGMVAYNLLLSVLPLALLALFIGGQVLSSPTFEHRVLDDLRRIFPNAAESTLSRALHRVEHSSGGIGIAALIASVWIGSSFWGALDTAFCRIYHVECRGWVQQKRFALGMLAVVLLFMAATLAVPTLQSILASGAGKLPLGLNHVRGVVFGISLVVGLLALWGILCLIYWRVPNEPVPWRAIWPGAAGATLVMAAVDYAFPFYLSNVNTIAQVGTTLVFILIVLIWFYVLAIILLGGATINAMRFEDDALRDTLGQPPSAAPLGTGEEPVRAGRPLQ
ncbi:MAG: YihY/virulence factor BrkB family protein [Actinomycetota bacterium]|nr:YihY/virulence factor BrkB family protein [Actinomycetota bacterium]